MQVPAKHWIIFAVLGVDMLLVVLFGGAYFLFDLSLATFTMPVIVALGVTMAFAYTAVIFLPRLTHQRLLITGETAEATILKATKTATQTKLHLEIHPTLKPSYQLEAAVILPAPQTARLQPGQVIRIKIDPLHPGRIAVIENV